jgi:hypothetical protein
LNRKAAAKLGVSNHQVHRLIKEGVLAAEHALFDAIWQIRASDLKVSASLAHWHGKVVRVRQSAKRETACRFLLNEIYISSSSKP